MTQRSSTARRFRKRHGKPAGFTLIPGRLIWWRYADVRFGWTTDNYGRVFDIGKLRFYP